MFGDPLPEGADGKVVGDNRAGVGVGFAGAFVEGKVEGDSVEAEGAEAHVRVGVGTGEDVILV